MEKQQTMIAAARGRSLADLLITNIQLVNTLSGEIHPANVAVRDGVVLGFEDYPARKTVDGGGVYLCPGFVEAHIHIESTLLAPPVFAGVAAARGTAAVVCDPHEIANVLGVEGIEYVLQSTRDLPISIYCMFPSCVPATHLENCGARLGVVEMQFLINKYPGRFPGLGEMMNFPGVIHGDPDVLAKLELARDLVIDGHAPGLTGMDLNAYIVAGPGSDHECVQLEEAREKLRKGMHVMIRQGTSEHNIAELLPMVTDSNWPGFSLVSDDRHPGDLARLGHMDENLRRAVQLGLEPVRAVQMATINPARYFGLKHRGAIAPGYRADLVLVEDLKDFKINKVYLGGVALEECSFNAAVAPPGNSMHIRKLNEHSFAIPANGTTARVIEIVPGQIVTNAALGRPVIHDDLALADPSSDLAKLAVVERHRATGNIGLGFVRGLGMQRGALASTVAHDSHNLITAGTNDADMLVAARAAQDMGGGLVAVRDGNVLAALPLPIAGLMSDKPLEEVVRAMEKLSTACEDMGLTHPNPFMVLSFLALPVIPELKLTDKGLVDVNRFELVGLWAD
ncbi:Adenine deaminase [Desulfonatronum thiosulfatophilum]|uniref:Adenine deaminase n=1 Tax=Desulfonatronum thiosulfatophilum TaxID=617002 RepID=A0A1G6DM04_9BACT|nr:adenine deaminase [Desulfonatronum thiosulfatophilum]SDB45835.1 Adenine deaminase [Desulfonatronum thiosulfatophilum]